MHSYNQAKRLIYTPSTSHNIRDFDFLIALFDHSSYSKNFEIIIYFICDLVYYPKYFKHNFSFFLLAQNFLIR